VEGAPRPRQNCRNGAAAIAHDLIGWDAEYSQTFLLQLLIAVVVARPSFGPIVHVAIDLDHQGSLATVEVDHIRVDRMLSAKLQSCRALAKLLPKKRFGGRHGPSERAGGVDGLAPKRR
jgi:hypothetical protein